MFKFLLSFFVLSFSINLIADNDSHSESLEEKIIKYYELLLAQKVTKNLLVNYKNYQESPNEYWNFLNETFVDNWDFDATTRGLIGRDIFDSLSDKQFKELSRTLQVTLIRYAFESLPFYSKQKLSVIDIKLNEQKDRAWLKINMDSPKFPDLHLDLFLMRTSDDHWRGADFRFKGIRYVKMKKNSYRQDFEDLKFQGLLRKLDDKNKVFFRDLCQSDANEIDPKKMPCLEI